MPITSLSSLPLALLVEEIAQERWARITDRAEGVYAQAEEKRTDTIAALAASVLTDDRYVALLVTRWLRNG